jgi:hypothetical protein
MPSRQFSFFLCLLLNLALASGCEGCLGAKPGNPLPSAEVITSAEFVYDSFLPPAERRRVTIPGDRAFELRRLFDQSRLDPDPARWVVLGELKLALKGGGSEVYTIYLSREGPGAYSDHLGRYFRGGTDAAFLAFLNELEHPSKTHSPATSPE